MSDNAIRRLLGAFYTPSSAADFMADWILRHDNQSLLEPSFGDGIFLRAIKLSDLRKGFSNTALFGVEIDATVHERAICEQLIDEKDAICKDFLSVIPSSFGKVDAVIGNPPYVRLRNLANSSQREHALNAAYAALGRPMEPSGSLWMPFLLHALQFLKIGGRLAFVLPYECTYVRYARPLWEKLGASFGSLHIVRTHERLFPDLLQESLILFADNYGGHTTSIQYQTFATIQHLLDAVADSESAIGIAEVVQGKRAFLTALLGDDLRSLLENRLMTVTSPARKRVTFNIGYVTGDKNYFHPDHTTLQEYQIPDTSLHPTFASARQMKGAGIYTSSLDVFTLDKLFLPDPLSLTLAEQRYIAAGEVQGISSRYKCRVRKPWFVVPGIRTPDVLLSVFSENPLLMANDAHYFASNSLLCGYVQQGTSKELVTGWYTSLTLLQCELEVHALGGGVMVMIPGEAGTIRLPNTIATDDHHLAKLDQLVKEGKIRQAYCLGDDTVLRGQLHLSSADVELIQQGIHRLSYWRTSSRGMRDK